ncbi:MAG: DnaA regulatory inactivator Hda [Gammaproteobacteria bacterium]
MSDVKFGQLALSVGLRDDATLDTFFSGDNQEMVATLSNVQQSQEQFIFLWGPDGVGKTHLLQGTCHSVTGKGHGALYLPLADLCYRSDLFVGLEQLSLVCLDDIDVIAGQSVWEEAIFHLFNRLKTSGTTLMVASTMPPRQLPIILPDLRSRLHWGLTYHIHPLNDEQKLKALSLRAYNRGIELPLDVGRFLLSRCVRNMGELYAILDQLDSASLAAQRRLTIPFVKRVLHI